MANDLKGLAAAACLDRASRQGLVYLGAAQVLREEAGDRLPPVEEAILGRLLAPYLAALPAREREDALSEGRSLPLAAVITHALSTAGRG